jgi:uncharacterized membrane protein YphA (DoxX/SURF4 family)
LLSAFSTFPDGLPGGGLLLLRAALGIALMVQGAAYIVDWHLLGFVTLAVALLIGASGGLLLAGYLTPLASILAGLFCLGSGFSWFQAPALELFDAKLTAAFATVISAALLCMGPGAFSVDARLFGRREIIIADTRPPKP